MYGKSKDDIKSRASFKTNKSLQDQFNINPDRHEAWEKRTLRRIHTKLAFIDQRKEL